MMDLSQVENSWTLFIDRDGVINYEKHEDYILNWEEFRFYEGASEAMEIFSKIFSTIIMVTNQRGVGKGLMTVDELHRIHSNMQAVIEESSGRIDKIYYCTSLDNDCHERKPNPGMALLAKNDYPHIDFSKSIMIGNKLSDMMFGRNAGMYTIYVDTTNPEVPSPHPAIDLRFKDVLDAAKAFESALRKS
jgi:D-glycero-D-manno-heptose 1,7-bisphosphate phosphatase